jgi:hypothetical protein
MEDIPIGQRGLRMQGAPTVRIFREVSSRPSQIDEAKIQTNFQADGYCGGGVKA